MRDFANILFGGPCNRRCPFCIGQQLPSRNNLDEYPPRNLDGLIRQVRAEGIPNVVLTGTTTDPQLYRHEERLLDHLREELPGVTLSLHTNGALALKKGTLNRYDKVCLSLPSFHPPTYAKMMGPPQVPDLAGILRAARIPVKVSCIVTDANEDEGPDFLPRCQELGLQRLVLRRIYGQHRPHTWLRDHTPVGHFRGNPVYDLNGLEVTCWHFEESESTSLNLFPDGRLTDSYLLARS